MVLDHRGDRIETFGDPRDARHLGAFLRSRRERLSPAAVGLPGGGRRRTPGLRREEVATLAGISVDYLVRLEQGRETRPSQPVLTSLADALRLNDDERGHLKQLAGLTAHPELCPSWHPPPEPHPLDRSTHALLDRLEPTPAFVLAHTSEVLAWNHAYEQLMGPTGLLDAGSPNLLQYTFLNPASRSLYREWEEIAREQVANLRALMPQICGDEDVARLVGDLSVRSADFVRLWATLDVKEKRQGIKRLVHPVVGDLALDHQVLVLPEPGHRRLVVYLPADDASARALDQLTTATDAGGEGESRLRLVGEG